MADIPDAELEQLRAEAAAGATAAAALEQATANIEAERAAGVTALTEALRSAHADLPADAIAGSTIEEVSASLARARSIADHVRAATPAPTTPAATAIQASAPARNEPQVPANARGVRRIAFALNNPGPGRTE